MSEEEIHSYIWSCRNLILKIYTVRKKTTKNGSSVGDILRRNKTVDLLRNGSPASFIFAANCSFKSHTSEQEKRPYSRTCASKWTEKKWLKLCKLSTKHCDLGKLREHHSFFIISYSFHQLGDSHMAFQWILQAKRHKKTSASLSSSWSFCACSSVVESKRWRPSLCVIMMVLALWQRWKASVAETSDHPKGRFSMIFYEFRGFSRGFPGGSKDEWSTGFDYGFMSQKVVPYRCLSFIICLWGNCLKGCKLHRKSTGRCHEWLSNSSLILFSSVLQTDCLRGGNRHAKAAKAIFWVKHMAMVHGLFICSAKKTTLGPYGYGSKHWYPGEHPA